LLIRFVINSFVSLAKKRAKKSTPNLIMSETTTTAVDINEMYQYATNLFIGGQNAYEVKTALLERGLDEGNANYIVEQLDQQINEARKTRAKKDMLYGALWCVGGLVLTLAHIGFIFWGAIVFGGIQFFRGVIAFNQ
jgi:fructosamine-3-kinase